MKNSKDNVTQLGLTSNSFLVNVMPQIKISQKTFRLNGIDPTFEDQRIKTSVCSSISK